MFPRPLPLERGCPLAFPLPLPFHCVWLLEDPLHERPEDALEERDEADGRDVERWGDLDCARECPADLFDADLARPRPFGCGVAWRLLVLVDFRASSSVNLISKCLFKSGNLRTKAAN